MFGLILFNLLFNQFQYKIILILYLLSLLLLFLFFYDDETGGEMGGQTGNHTRGTGTMEPGRQRGHEQTEVKQNNKKVTQLH